jgi:RecA-family ATPase
MLYEWWAAEQLAQAHFEQPYIFYPIVPYQGVVFLHGKRAIGKTQLLLTLAGCIVHRGMLFGRYPVQRSGPVVVVEADMAAGLVHERLKLAHRYGYQFPDVHFVFPNYLNILALTPKTPLVQEIQQRQPVLIVWDTLAKIFQGDTNLDLSATLVYGKAKDLFPEATHLFIHHDRKTRADDVMLGSQDELFRGSGAWSDNADTALHLLVNGHYRLLQFTKLRTCEPQKAIPLVRTPALLLQAAQSPGSWGTTLTPEQRRYSFAP